MTESSMWEPQPEEDLGVRYPEPPPPLGPPLGEVMDFIVHETRTLRRMVTSLQLVSLALLIIVVIQFFTYAGR